MNAEQGVPPPPTGRRREVLEVLRASSSAMSIVRIAERLGVHPNTVRFHLDALAETGLVERVDAAPAGPGRPPLVFRARRGMDPSGPRNYRLLAGILAGTLAADPDPVGRATEAGRAWGRQLAEPPASPSGIGEEEAVGRLMSVLDDLGFAPERRPADARGPIGLRHCPFLDLVGTQARVVCPVHLGLMQGVMTAMGSPVTVERLEPFAGPDLCLAHLAGAGSPP
ncbi:putative ArsR family transcriptional regulator [Streptosporangium becharense]|uniref:Putative ArsR family transcriptional regulator n=1 Tax=Streptosporangium becharense TaxID=1816182 RepID=A0A7W9IAY3_9ACTN|nr:helix-turn-helix domain-containing protein [Streptosporangium becharense]MBB2910643.1 putative ArsR family transcriptional regulator [Streptosporangium becharense]MBB5817338.1 putative ArsR family transcriptional regulator [Streptosporangium becharense]